jgi:hypothetical protein
MKINKSKIYIFSTFVSFIKFGGVSVLDIVQLLLISSAKKLRIVSADYYFFALGLIGLLSSGINGNIEGIFYTLRLFPAYVAFILIREMLIVEKLIAPALLLSIVQMFFAPILVYNWFAGVVAGLIAVVLAQRRKFALCAFSIALVWLTDQRSLIVAVVVAMLAVTLYTSWRNRLWFCLLAFASFLIISTYSSGHRIYKTFDAVSNIQLLSIAEIGLSQAGSKSYREFVYQERELIGGPGSGDLSLHLRLRKWLHAASTMQKNNLKIIYGVGPAYFGKAADSAFLRIFFETGVIGLIMFFAWYVKFIGGIKNIASPTSLYFLVSNMFLDVFYSPLLMSIMLPFLYNLRKS